MPLVGINSVSYHLLNMFSSFNFVFGCFRCHVMERESFENHSIAKVMNEKFVNIKMDREERPDIDKIYMNVVQAISGSGGWGFIQPFSF